MRRVADGHVALGNPPHQVLVFPFPEIEIGG